MAVQSEIRAQDALAARGGDSVRFIGNATLLIRFGPLTILTDPNFVGRAAEVPLGFGLTATRTTDPAMEADEVPQPDIVVLSHDHGDHFDSVAADWLNPATPIATCSAAAAPLAAQGFTAVRPLDTWQSTELEKDGARVRVTAVPARHAPGPLAAVLPDVMGSVLELWHAVDGAAEQAPPDLTMYISGDTILFDELAEIARRYPEPDLAFIHLGGMRLMGVTVTLDARDGVTLLEMLRPKLAIPIHYNDYGTSRSSLAEFVARVNQAGLADRVRYLRHGESWQLSARSEPPA